jgi:hypothetical protein
MSAPQPSRARRITDEVLSWAGTTAAPHRFGGVELRLGRREIGHLHGDEVADVPFPRRVRDRLVADGRAAAHHWLPDSGWVTFRMTRDEDVPQALELLRLSYDRALAAAEAGDRRRDAARGVD